MYEAVLVAVVKGTWYLPAELPDLFSIQPPVNMKILQQISAIEVCKDQVLVVLGLENVYLVADRCVTRNVRLAVTCFSDVLSIYMKAYLCWRVVEELFCMQVLISFLEIVRFSQHSTKLTFVLVPFSLTLFTFLPCLNR